MLVKLMSMSQDHNILLMILLIRESCIGLQPRPLSIHYAPGHRGHRNELWPKGGKHPERPGRLDDVILPFIPSNEIQWQILDQSRPDAEAALRRVHDDAHIQRVKEIRLGREKLGPDTYVIPSSFGALLEAQSLWLDAVDEVLERGRYNTSWALSRPPGHHASRGSADGFCIFNFCAAAAAYAIQVKGLERIAILDFDGHHGNGIAAYADEESRVTYASVHQAPLWPGTGDDANDRGPLSNRLSAPVSRGAQGKEYLKRWAECISFTQSKNPQLVIVSAGFDALSADPLVQCQLKPIDFMYITLQLRTAFPHTPIVLGLEGGYSNDAGLAFAQSLRPFLDSTIQHNSTSFKKNTNSINKDVVLTTTLQDKSLIRLGKLCLCLDATGNIHAVCGRLPPLGLPTAAFGVFDPQVRSITECGTGTRFYVETGELRGAWCSKRPFLSILFRPRRMAVAQVSVVENTVTIAHKDFQRLNAEFDRLSLKKSWKPYKKFLLTGVASRYRTDILAASAPVTITTSAREGIVKTTAIAGNLQVGYYLVRTPRRGDPPTIATDFIIADLLHNGNFEQIDKSHSDKCARVAVGVAVFVEPAARKRKLGLILFKQAMLACRRLGFKYMLFVERDTGSGRLVKWYENMGFSKIPPDALPGLDRAMIGQLPDPDLEPDFYDVPLPDDHDISITPYTPPSTFIWSFTSLIGNFFDFLGLWDDTASS